MTPSQREASKQSQIEASAARYRAWLAQRHFINDELARMPRRDAMASVVPGGTSMEEAVERADTIVRGTVKAIRFEPWVAVVTLNVDDALKGAAKPGTELTIFENGGPTPEGPNLETVFMGVWGGSPVQLPGERAIWLLSRSTHEGRLYPQGYTGVLRSVNGKLSSNPDSPLADLVDGKDEEVIWEQLRALSVISARTPPTTFAPPDPAISTKAEAAVFQTSDFPSGWSSIDGSRGGLALETIWWNLTRCLGVRFALKSTGDVTSETFLRPVATQAQSTVEYARPGPAIQTVRAALESPAFSKCAEDVFGDAIGWSAPAGASVGAVSVGPLEAPVRTDHVFAAQITAPVTLPDLTITIVQDFVVVFDDSSVTRMLFLDAGKPFDPQLERTLAEAVVGRS